MPEFFRHFDQTLRYFDQTLRYFDQTPRFCNSEVSILHYTQNLGAFSLRLYNSEGFFQVFGLGHDAKTKTRS